MNAAPVGSVRTRKQCRKLIRDRASISYTITTVSVLLNLLDGTYNPKHGDSAEAYKVTRTLKSIMRGLTIELRQFEYIIKRLRADEIVLDYHRENGRITYRLDLSPLEAFEDVDEREVKKLRNADRAAKAREQRALNRVREKPVLRSGDVEQLYEEFGLDGLPPAALTIQYTQADAL